MNILPSVKLWELRVLLRLHKEHVDLCSVVIVVEDLFDIAESLDDCDEWDAGNSQAAEAGRPRWL